MKRTEPTISILKGDRVVTWRGSTATNNMRSNPGETHVNLTHDDDPRRFGIPMHRDGVVEVWRNGEQVWPPAIVQGRLL